MVDTEIEFDRPKRNYELAFHLNPALTEAQVLELKEGYEKDILAKGGTVSFSKVPEKTHLSYPIKHQKFSLFGYIHFSTTSSELLAEMDEKLRLSGDVLRYIFLQLETDAQKQKAISKAAQRTRAQAEKMSRKQTATPKEDSPEMEKQLEDIISGL